MRSLFAAILLFSVQVLAFADDVVHLACPGEGRVPHPLLAEDGKLHLAYGKDADGWHVRADHPGGEWSQPVRINSEAGTVSVGKERSPKIALGKDGSLHAVWQDKGKRVCYARSADGGASWSEERTLSEREGVDQPAIAADGKGKVWVVWIDGREGEDARQPSSGALYLARSEDDGATFGANYPARFRACACCALEAGVGSDGRLRVAYRGAQDGMRDIHLLEADSRGERFQSTRVSDDGWRLDQCPMDSPILALEAGGRKILVAWRSRDEVYWTGAADGRRFAGRQAPAVPGGDRLYPVIALGKGGTFLFAWAEGDAVVWELHDRTGRISKTGKESGLPGRNRFGVVAGEDGTFHLVF